MRRSLTFSLLAIVAVAVVALGATLASGSTPRLGLDLQGGASVVLSPVNCPNGCKQLDQAERIIRRRVDGLGVAEPNITRQGNNIVVELPGVKNATTALDVVGQTAKLQFRPVLAGPYPGAGPAAPAPSNPANGTSGSPATSTPGASTPPSSTPPASTPPSTPPSSTPPPSTPPASTPSAGTPGVGTTPAATPTSGPGAPTSSGALGASGLPAAQLASFLSNAPPLDAAVAAVNAAGPQSPAPTAGPPAPAAPAATAGPPAPAAPAATTPAAPAAAPSTAPATATVPPPPTVSTPAPAASAGPPITPPSVLNVVSSEKQTVVLPEIDPKTNAVSDRYILGPVLLGGDIVSTATPQVEQTTGVWSVQVGFTGKGGSLFDSVVAKQYYSKQVAIVLDNKIESAPTINAQQFNGQATITGGASGFTHKAASNLALVLRYGALPVQLTRGDVQTVSASLGKDSLHAGLVAGFIGLALVLLYMVLYYRALGIVVLLGLSVSGALLFSLVTYLGQSSLHQSLSLSGVVGIIVSVGVTVDSYIVFFERLKDDIRAGKSIRSSTDRSFARAWRTIWTADLVSIIAAILLFLLTVGAVRGFAFFLGLSTLLDLLVAYTFTRPMVVLVGRNRTFTEARHLGVARGLAVNPAGGTA